ncbi:pentatricopeptide repeat-containing protein [Pyrus ussuriensis x Pyrus communis]|uniref:Pentatricopeptide repeat-containing protein n=1 Tax=Pyrus ussuriensis x Pyrus communis TaxID=2448454 RepID=A0A5N5GBQ1_9ROSA|nr:pentatricopeptide repeat-containing protein [Pyrus ussuriensis x Pyrus communis]
MLENQCPSRKDLQKIHAHLLKTGLANDTIAASRVLAFSASPPGDINYAYMVFRHIKEPNPFIWNTIIRGFSESQNPKLQSLFSLKCCFMEELQNLASKDIKFIRNTIIHMYANCGFLSEARELFDEDLECDNVAWNSMVMDPSKCGEVSESKRLFDKTPSRNLVSWNSMISGSVRNGKYAEALDLFGEMQKERIRPSEFTMVSLLNASAQLGAIGQGEWILEHIKKNGIETNGIVVTAIINMYCKCGSIEKAIRVFYAAPKKRLSCWNTMIMGLAVNGCEEEAIELFSRLESSKFIPDGVSFLGVVTAYYSSMVNVLGRAGLLEDAEGIIDNMPVKADAIIWGSLLSSCRKHKNIKMAKQAAKRVIELDPNDSCGYVLMSNIYAASSQFHEAIKERLSTKEEEVHEFIASGRLHQRVPEIYSLLDELGFMMPEMG